MKPSSFLATSFFGSCLLACSALGSDTSTMEADHTEGEPTFAQYRWLWSDESEDEFKSIVGWDTSIFLPTDHAMTQRLQFWVDQMDEALRVAHPKALDATPKPRVVVVKDASPNALVSFMPVAWHVPTRLARAGDVRGEPDAIAREIAITSTAAAAPVYDAPLERAHGPNDLDELLKFYNENFATCRLSLDAGTIVFGEGCRISTKLSAARSERLAFYATGKWLTITTGLLTSVSDEEHIVAIVAHELGHYYRSHGSQPTDVLNYFYALGSANHTHKPPPDTRFTEQTLAVREKLRSRYQDFGEENRLMKNEKLGFYTTEQEADEIAIEVLAKIGLPLTLGPDAMIALQKALERNGGLRHDPDALSWEQCSALRERGFRDESGQPAVVPVGNISDPHHSLCFRVFNMTREIEAHQYELAPSPPRPSGEWSDLLARLADQN